MFCVIRVVWLQTYEQQLTIMNLESETVSGTHVYYKTFDGHI